MWAEPVSLWDAMPILTIRHVTTYTYKQPVAFGEHRMMLRPRDDDDQKLLESELEITPEPSQLTWMQDHCCPAILPKAYRKLLRENTKADFSLTLAYSGGVSECIFHSLPDDGWNFYTV